MEDLKCLHETIVAKLDEDLVKAVCPKGWMVDHTEHACCEHRRLSDAQALNEAGKGPRKVRDSSQAAERQRKRCERLRSGPTGRECWRALGFHALPSNAVAR